ncbi:MAG: 30S ribosomal protein S1, partial [Paludibacter sp.]|nr:30S ribosomal protein S1 [Paludibacter sp.]
IEFNKDSKRIILSHSRVWEDEKRAENPVETAPEGEAKAAKKGAKKTKKEETASQPVIEKTTLGDIQELADLKDQLVVEATEKFLEKHAAKKTVKSKAEETVENEAEAKEEKAEVEEKPAKKATKSTKKAKADEDEKPADAPAETAEPKTEE